MHRKAAPPASQLLANFQSFFVSAATVEAAHYEADRSENELINHLQNVSSGSYLQPANMAGQEDALTRASLDAHIKKVQADQLDQMSAEQLQQLQQQTQADFVGRKITITVTNPLRHPVESYWYDQRNGNRTSVGNKKQYGGTIESVLLDKNALIIKPSLGSRMLFSNLQNYIAYVIDPETLTPMIDVTIS